MIFGPLKKTWAPFGLNFTRRLKLDPCGRTCTHAGGSSPQPALNTQPVALGGCQQVKILPWGHLTCWLHGGGTWPAAPTGVGKPLVLFLPLYWSGRVGVFLNGMFLYFIAHHCRRLIPFSWSNLINSTMMEAPVWTTPASDGQLEPDSTANSLFNMFTQDN